MEDFVVIKRFEKKLENTSETFLSRYLALRHKWKRTTVTNFISLLIGILTFSFCIFDGGKH